jgi:predicted secreted Zn-dependent protease
MKKILVIISSIIGIGIVGFGGLVIYEYLNHEPFIVEGQECPVKVADPEDPDLTKLSPGVNVSERNEYYPIYADEMFQFHDQLNHCSLDNGGLSDTNTPAITVSSLNFSYDYIQQETYCEMSNIKVGLSNIYQLPKWEPVSDPNVKVEEIWENFNQVVTEHELSHGRIAKDLANELYSFLSNPGEVNCDDVYTKATTLQYQLDERNKAFDLETDHDREKIDKALEIN